jgi:hypothetical protein
MLINEEQAASKVGGANNRSKRVNHSTGIKNKRREKNVLFASA